MNITDLIALSHFPRNLVPDRCATRNNVRAYRAQTQYFYDIVCNLS